MSATHPGSAGSGGAGTGVPSLFIVGYRATGKTTVGRLAAARLGVPFADTDTLVEQAAGMAIARVFSERGEPWFRDAESAALEAVARRIEAGERLVVATGGGIVLRDSNVRRMRALGRVVWLRAGTDTIRRRLESDPATAAQRPGLTGASAAAEVDAVLRARLPLYEAAAHDAVDAGDDRSPEAIADALANWLKRGGEPTENSIPRRPGAEPRSPRGGAR